ncbi:hypothetical protein ECUMN_0070 [Escherichia coli UMN026]|uniref:Uncharacterized protein n=1 Tax=Escherichia coli O17:K52:H18 (strain UMN026 / ExPEC) TaxID=585056 RepID=B7N7U3_ECOLU|nr:hypothetical protein ECUMN_0070 [Escherichia coli UMN026]
MTVLRDSFGSKLPSYANTSLIAERILAFLIRLLYGLLVDNKITTLTPFSTGCHADACAEKIPVEPDPDNAGEGI